ncbi:hypothetical protein WOSG25_170180 [Weissella oryzae SG25]|uniref:Uncharacterized protein n=1 Tax=Weissella oryzae (strain DSM 25784 / JCM 18191 / LMG 30913 / SG25) TaxID=1329250 RepID=A0A069CVN5_WEIOS|nr:hypothetical protein [Weissella oryzae]GAK31835.1 hypothetical protein WOSG25_170180 [Weissella oryzae SG25]
MKLKIYTVIAVISLVVITAIGFTIHSVNQSKAIAAKESSIKKHDNSVSESNKRYSSSIEESKKVASKKSSEQSKSESKTQVEQSTSTSSTTYVSQTGAVSRSTDNQVKSSTNVETNQAVEVPNNGNQPASSHSEIRWSSSSSYIRQSDEISYPLMDK